MADRFYAAIDVRIGRALDGGYVVGLAADHGMQAKTLPGGAPNVRFIDDALAEGGVTGATTLLPITDPYVVHHAALGSLAWVHLADLGQLDRARGVVAALPGVEGVLDRAAAAQVFELPADRIGDLIVLADRTTVLGRSAAAHDLSAVGETLRSHGGLHEQCVPIVVCQPLREGALRGRQLRNRDLHDLLLNEIA